MFERKIEGWYYIICGLGENYSTHRRSKLERALWSSFMFSRALQNERKTFRVHHKT